MAAPNVEGGELRPGVLNLEISIFLSDLEKCILYQICVYKLIYLM